MNILAASILSLVIALATAAICQRLDALTEAVKTSNKKVTPVPQLPPKKVT